MLVVAWSPPVPRHRVLHRPQPLPAHGPPQGGLHVELLYGQQLLGVLLLLAPAAAGEAAGTAGGDGAEEDPQEGEEDAAAHQAGPDQLQLQGLEALVPDADEGDDETDADHAEADVEDDVGAPGAFQLVSIDLAAVNGSPLGSADSSLGELQHREGQEISKRNMSGIYI